MKRFDVYIGDKWLGAVYVEDSVSDNDAGGEAMKKAVGWLRVERDDMEDKPVDHRAIEEKDKEAAKGREFLTRELEKGLVKG